MRVLIAEYETLIRLDLKGMLESAGLEVCAEARDGVEAVELADSAEPDLAVGEVTRSTRSPKPRRQQGDRTREGPPHGEPGADRAGRICAAPPRQPDVRAPMRVIAEAIIQKLGA